MRPIALPLALVSAAMLSREPVRAGPPNLLFIVADDLGWADLACHGNDLHETPNLDRLAAEGVRFTDNYAASPVCSPTRASFLTGRFPARLRMTIWREAALERGKRKLLEPVCLDSLPLEETTLAEILRGAGYHCAHIGKWHLGRAEAYPQPHGFHENIGGTLWGAPQTFFYPFSGGQYFPDWRYVPDLEPGAPGEYLTDKLADAAIGVIERESRNGRPFFVNLWFHTVHTPIEGKPDLVKRYEAKIGPDSIRKNPHYAAMVHSLDENVGRVLAKLDELGIAGETIVAFTSDNGGFVNTCKLHPGLQVADNTPLRGGKGSCHEGGIRTPLIVRAPGVTPAGAECHEPVFSCDLMPTFLRLAGLDAGPPSPVDGVDLTPLLRDPAATLGREALYFHYPHYYPTTTPVGAIRMGEWKLLEYLGDGGPPELYRLTDDLGETRNLAGAEPDRRDAMLAKLRAWRESVGAQMPEPNPDFKSKK
ncbi:MAG: sulfatase [Akkermansiaceae bacterium]|nr:sulfatase [Akkermansiaceae bacterium]MCP5550297.1 sulfatase [Akkermansiaceae bacterium]